MGWPKVAIAQLDPFFECSKEAAEFIQKGDIYRAEQAAKKALAEAENAFWFKDSQIVACLGLLTIVCFNAG